MTSVLTSGRDATTVYGSMEGPDVMLPHSAADHGQIGAAAGGHSSLITGNLSNNHQQPLTITTTSLGLLAETPSVYLEGNGGHPVAR